MSTKPGRLYKTLAPSEPLFALTMTGGDQYDDNSIIMITINRGDASTLAGMQPSTLEVDLAGKSTKRMTGKTVTLNLTSAGRSLLSNMTGKPSAYFYERFVGRAGTFKYTDSPRTAQQITKIMAGSWAAQERNSGKRLPIVGKNQPISEILGRVLYRAGRTYTYTARGEFERTGIEFADASFDDIWGKLADDIYIPAPVKRNGTLSAVSLPQLFTETQERLNSTPHLTRSQVLSPVEWEQPNEVNSELYSFLHTNSDGVVIRQDLQYTWAGSNIPDFDTTEIDWKQLRLNDTGHFLYAARGYIMREASQRWFLSNVTVDLLHLLRSANPYDRDVAGFLLTLEVGESVNLSGDWPIDVSGVYFAAAIKEHISSNEWTLEISLLPFLWVFGEQSPVVPPRVWGSFAHPWNEETRNWNLEG